MTLFNRNGEPQETVSDTTEIAAKEIEEGFVISTTDITDSIQPAITIKPASEQTVIDAVVPQPVASDRGVPAEGARVYYTERADGRAIVIGAVATDHDGYKQTQRRIDHPYSDAHVTFNADGSVTVQSDDTTVSIDGGSITIDGGSTPVVTDVTTTTDADGHVTDVSTTTDDSIQL